MGQLVKNQTVLNQNVSQELNDEDLIKQIPREKDVKPIIPGKRGDPHRKYRIGKQILLVLVYVGLGLFNEILGPTLPDLKNRIGVNYEVISKALIGKSVGAIVGAIIGGFTYERHYQHSDLIVACGIWLASISTVIIPFGKHLEVVGFLFALCGVSEGLIDAGGNAVVMDLWRERTAAPMSSLHFGFGVGALLGPQIARPFLSPDARDQSEDPISTAAPTTLGWNMTSPTPEGSTIEYAYAIVASIVFMLGFILLGVYIKGPPEGLEMRQPSTNWSEMVKPSSCGYGHTFFAVELLILLLWHFIHSVGGERAMSQFLFSFAVEAEVQFTKVDASSLQTAFWGSFTAGRLLGVPISSFVPVWVIMMVDAVGVTIVGIVMSIYASSNRRILWVTSCLFGFFISMSFPNGMSWANLHLKMNNVSVMILIIGGACGGFIYQYPTGFFFENDPKNLPYVLIASGVCLLLGFVIMHTLATVHGRRIHLEERSSRDEDESIKIGHIKESDMIYSITDNSIVSNTVVKPDVLSSDNMAFEDTPL